MRFKNLEGKPKRESLKKTIFASNGLELLQIVLESDTEQCVSPKEGGV